MPIVEFIVPGTPISVGASGRSRTRWRERVIAAAVAALPDGYALEHDPVRVTVIYFYVRTDLDLDNIRKPLLDAMNRTIYVDDFQVVDIVAAKRDLAGPYALAAVSPVIVRHVGPGIAGDFVFILIEPAPVEALT